MSAYRSLPPVTAKALLELGRIENDEAWNHVHGDMVEYVADILSTQTPHFLNAIQSL